MAKIVYNYPPVAVPNLTTGPIQFSLNTVDTVVSRDTSTPANSRPLPVINLDSSGEPVDPVKDFGVSIDADRVAALLGNETGLADFDEGVAGAQTLRTVLEDQSRDAIGIVSETAVTDPTLSGSIIALLKGILKDIQDKFIDLITFDYGASADALRTAAQIGNTTGEADFNAGIVGAQTLRTVLEDQTRDAVGDVADLSETDPTQSASMISLQKGLLEDLQNKFLDEIGFDYGVSTAALRTASQVGNATGVADFDEGAVSAQTLRTVLEDQSRDAIGAETDAAVTNPASNASMIALLKGLLTGINSVNSFTGTVRSARITVGTTAVRATTDGNAPPSTRKLLVIKPTIGNSGLIFYGASGLTTTTSVQIVGPDTREFKDFASDIYLISDTAAQTVEIMEIF